MLVTFTRRKRRLTQNEHSVCFCCRRHGSEIKIPQYTIFYITISTVQNQRPMIWEMNDMFTPSELIHVQQHRQHET